MNQLIKVRVISSSDQLNETVCFFHQSSVTSANLVQLKEKIYERFPTFRGRKSKLHWIGKQNFVNCLFMKVIQFKLTRHNH